MTDDDTTPALDAFLSSIAGDPVPYVEAVDQAEMPYCDSCTEPMHPNREAQLYAVSRSIDGREPDSGLMVTRIHCEDCVLPMLHFPCQEYGELLIDIELDTDWVVRDPSLRDGSPPDAGIPWSPVDVMEAVFGVSYDTMLAASDHTVLGPVGVVDILVLLDLDPRAIIQPDGRIDTDAIDREALADRAAEFLADTDPADLPPQPSVADRLAGWGGYDE